jgi:hypothetical protein
MAGADVGHATSELTPANDLPLAEPRFVGEDHALAPLGKERTMRRIEPICRVKERWRGIVATHPAVSRLGAIAQPARGSNQPLYRAIFEARIPFTNGEVPMAKPNYAFQKRQREIAKKQKKEAKLKERQAQNAPPDAPAPDAPPEPQSNPQGS